MARVTVEDCIDKVENRFELVLLAGHRARQISAGAEITIERDNDKNPVVALREIAEETLSPADLKEDLIHSLQKHVEVDEPENEEIDEIAAPSIIEIPASIPLHGAMEEPGSAQNPGLGGAPDGDKAEVNFDQMSEEELLASIEGLVPPEKGDDY